MCNSYDYIYFCTHSYRLSIVCINFNLISMKGSSRNMGNLTRLLVLLIAFQLALGFTFQRRTESYETASSTNYDNSQSTGSSNQSVTSGSGCCTLNSWAYKNYGDVREFASRLRQEYNSMSSGSISGSSINYRPWAGKFNHYLLCVLNLSC